MNSMIQTVDTESRMNAAALIEGQKRVPLSPLRRLSNGSVELCAAAAFIIANVRDADERMDLIAQFESGGREAVLNAYPARSWPIELGRHLLQENDAFGEDDRKRGVLELLRP